MTFRIRRVYEQATASDGYRVLVDRIWPRGLSKEQAKIDLWLKEIAPSTALRQWFKHDPAKWNAFQKKYRSELKKQEKALAPLRERGKSGTVTLLYAAKDQENNNAVALKNWLERR